jgi:hypothetical protein
MSGTSPALPGKTPGKKYYKRGKSIMRQRANQVADANQLLEKLY